MPEQLRSDATALHRKGSLTLERLEHARLGSPRDPTLTAPEWELLAAFQLNTMDAVRQRMHERAMLAAYDGAPSALTEVRIEQAPASMGEKGVPSRPQKLPDTRQEALLETTLSYDPETLRASLRYMVTWRQVEQLADGQPLETQESAFHAVSFDVDTGRVTQREYGTTLKSPHQATAQHDVTLETVDPTLSPTTGLH